MLNKLTTRHGRFAATILAGLASLPASALAEGGDAAVGEALFARCGTCHEVGEGARHRLGPHLDGLLGREAGSLDDFRYSPALKAAGGEGLAWSAETLDAFLADPRGVVPGNRMAFPGIKDAGDRADLVAYLASFATAVPAPEGTTPAGSGDGDPQAGAAAQAILALAGDPAYGAYLAGECVTCHRPSGGPGIPAIAGLPADYLVLALVEYRLALRDNEVMVTTAARLGDADIAALAAHFSALE
ncbi:c-type cytochrome [Shinella sp.]|uniref:c-type cytochrome n=1 Tax=Shinella sp. TaxID=1870904 RepID=UPI003F71B5F4